MAYRVVYSGRINRGGPDTGRLPINIVRAGVQRLVDRWLFRCKRLGFCRVAGYQCRGNSEPFTGCCCELRGLVLGASDGLRMAGISPRGRLPIPQRSHATHAPRNRSCRLAYRVADQFSSWIRIGTPASERSTTRDPMGGVNWLFTALTRTAAMGCSRRLDHAQIVWFFPLASAIGGGSRSPCTSCIPWQR
jgi:hypothetical protein